MAFWGNLILKHVSKLPLRKQYFSLKNRPSGEGRSEEGWLANGLHVPCSLMDRLGEELRDACMGLSPKAEGREVPWVQGSGEGELWP